MKFGLRFLIGLLSIPVCAFAGESIVTIAGGGSNFADGPALEATFDQAEGLAIDSAGNIYVADTAHNRIRKIDLNGNINTIVGGGDQRATGSGEAALSIFLEQPVDLVFDPAGDLLICDRGNSRVFRLNMAAQTLHLVAGNGTFGFSGDGGPATQAAMNTCFSLAVDAQGNIFIADVDNGRVRRVEAATGIINTVAGTGEGGFSGGDGVLATAATLDFPGAVAVNAAGDLFIMDGNNSRIRRVDKATQMTSTFAGNGVKGFYGDGGDALKASILFPRSMKFDAAGNLVILDTFNQRVRRINTGAAPTTSYDSDADGFPDNIEAAALTLPNDAASTPFSGQTPNKFAFIDISKLSATVNFSATGKDKIQIAGLIFVPDGTVVSGQQVLLDVAGMAFAFSLDAKGKSASKSDNSFKVSTKVKDGAFKYTISLNKGSFAAPLAKYNMINTEIKGAQVTLPVTIYFNNTVNLEAAFCAYNAKLGKTGKAATGRGVIIPGMATDTLSGRK